MTSDEPEPTPEDTQADDPETPKDPAKDPGPRENPEVDESKMREALDDKSKELW